MTINAPFDTPALTARASITGSPAILPTRALFIAPAPEPTAENADTSPGLMAADVSETIINAPLAVFIARKLDVVAVPSRAPVKAPTVAPAAPTMPVAIKEAVPETVEYQETIFAIEHKPGTLDQGIHMSHADHAYAQARDHIFYQLA